MIQKTISTTIELCSRCINNEINAWLEDRWHDINDRAKKEISQEMKTIKLKEGECTVCRNNLVSDETAERILSILKENSTPKQVQEEFKKYFIC